ncbi:MAG TPA: phosphoenolpyruvate synthase [Nanoarchaeota archaeon]|nr:phosphoenolpyruvate synthase [Nanoarchaeota archaeon]
MADIAWFRELSNKDVAIAGGKGASLGEMFNAGLPIPPGFVITADAFKKFITTTGIADKIYSILSGIDVENNTQLQEAAKKVQSIVLATPMPEDIKKAIIEAYDYLCFGDAAKAGGQTLNVVKAGRDALFVAVRSSATAEDLPNASFAGQQASFLNIRGQVSLISAVQQCWASLYTARAIYYRIKNNFEHSKVLIAVVVQKMANSDKAGVMFSINPATNNEDEIMIEASYGLGESVVSGSISPDQYIVDKKSEQIKSVKLSKKDWMYTLDKATAKTIRVNIPKEYIEAQALSSYEIISLAKLAKKIEQHYGRAQDLEYAIEGKNIYIVQSRPVTTLKKSPAEKKDVEAENAVARSKAAVLVTGMGASPGVGTGPVKIVKTVEDLEKIQKGDVLVATMTNPDYVSAMEKSVAIVTDEGGVTCHAAIVGREMGIPVIVGTEVATKTLRENQIVTIDASEGKVYDGKVEIKKEEKAAGVIAEAPLETVTSVKVIMDLPEFAQKVAALNPDGVGLLRCEMMMAKHEHPAYLLSHGKKEVLFNELVDSISKIATAFKGKPVWYRTSDFRTDEYRNLPGGQEEPHEENPMLGWHGIRRGLTQKELLKTEFEAIRKVHDMGLTNVGVMLPMVTHAEEVEESKRMLKAAGFEPCKNIEFGVMIETPAAVQIIDEICKVGITFISFGTNDLTQYTMAVDRNNARVQNLYDEMHPAILRQIKHVVETCQKYGVETSICGQAGSRPEMAEFLVKIGIDSISANSDAINTIRSVVSKIERKLILEAARKEVDRQ